MRFLNREMTTSLICGRMSLSTGCSTRLYFYNCLRLFVRDDSSFFSSSHFRTWIFRFGLAAADSAILALSVLAAHRLYPSDRFLREQIGGEGAPGTVLLVVSCVIAVHLFALAWGGAYAPPRRYRFQAFVRFAGSLAVAFTALSITFYAVTTVTPAPGTMLIFMMMSFIGLIGLRALLRQWIERPSLSLDPAPAVRPSVRLHDFVDRPTVEIDTRGLRHLLEGRTVLVTGAGGSIGSHLCSQLARLQPSHIVMADVSEFNVFTLQQAMERRPSSIRMTYSITDVRNPVATERLFQMHRPDVVLHTAAYKHVPMMERHPAESFENNTLATRLLVDLAAAYDTDQFIFVSTDKAVEPRGILGTTKRLAEWYVQAKQTTMKRKIVRFGNVFGSRGSVVPFFEQRLQQREPLPITHPDMERYFMTADEACNLILQTLLHDTYPVYLLRMGTSIRIEWLARQMIEAYYPDRPADTMIEYVGCRPGEKLSEQLITTSEATHPSGHQSIMGVSSRSPWTDHELRSQFDQFSETMKDLSISVEDLHGHLVELARVPSGDGQLASNRLPDVRPRTNQDAT